MGQATTKTNTLGGPPRNDVAVGESAIHSVFIAEQSLGTLLRNSMALYRANFRPLFFTYVLPTFPFLMAQEVGQLIKNDELFIGAAIFGTIVSMAAIGAITITIADICLGNSPSVRRSYSKLMQNRLWLSLLLTTMLQLIVTFLGLLLLVVPGLILSVRLLFAPSAVVLERLSGYAALKRSFDLSKGHFWRLWVAVTILFLVFYVAPLSVAMLVSGAGGAAVAAFASSEHHVVLMILSSVMPSFLWLLCYPLFFIGIVLLYYDLRVRKEAYDVAALSEDMMR